MEYLLPSSVPIQFFEVAKNTALLSERSTDIKSLQYLMRHSNVVITLNVYHYYTNFCKAA